MFKLVEKKCLNCKRTLFVTSDPKAVRYWQKKIQLSGGKEMIHGFFRINTNLVRITHSKPKVEVWGNFPNFPEKEFIRTLCPECMQKFKQKHKQKGRIKQ
ncbi:hypothetical protein J7K42_01250 [bacterium]|nr:hypothetical protein [bacterium]